LNRRWWRNTYRTGGDPVTVNASTRRLASHQFAGLLRPLFTTNPALQADPLFECRDVSRAHGGQLPVVEHAVAVQQVGRTVADASDPRQVVRRPFSRWQSREAAHTLRG
jgi:hypothetical protein